MARTPTTSRRTPRLAAGVPWFPEWSSYQSVDREVVAALISAGLLLAQLHEDVVEERRCADAEEIGIHPFGAEGFVEDDEVREGELGVGDSAGRLHADFL